MHFDDQNIPILLAGVFFLILLLLSVGVYNYFAGVRRRRDMLNKIRSTDQDWLEMEPDQYGPKPSGGTESILMRTLKAFGGKAGKAKLADDANVKLKFLRAGVRDRDAVLVFRGFKLLLFIVLPMIFLLVVFGLMDNLELNRMVLGTAGWAFIGFLLPDLWLILKTRSRKEKMFKAFPDALDLLVVCVESGMGLDASMRRVGEELKLGHPALSQEFNLLNLELRAGKTKTMALKNLADRTNMEDVQSLATLLIQTDRFGTSVAQALRVFSDSFRTARYQRAEEAAAKLPTKLIFPLAFFIFPSFFLVAIGPSLIQLFRIFLDK